MLPFNEIMMQVISSYLILGTVQMLLAFTLNEPFPIDSQSVCVCVRVRARLSARKYILFFFFYLILQ